jgi:outer membrane receptor protein involved in Fe transport
MTVGWAALASCSFAAAVAAAGEPTVPGPDSSPAFHEELVVIAERGPQRRDETAAAVSVMTRSDIEALPADSLGEILKFVPGFHVLFAETAERAPVLSARGFFGGGEAEYVQLFVDGIPVGDLESGLADWGAIRAANVERVETLRGPASAQYGDTALAGAVQVFTRPVSGSGRGGYVSVVGGRFGAAAVDVGYRRAIRGGWMSASGQGERTDGSRDHASVRHGGLALSLGADGDRQGFAVAVSGHLRDAELAGPRAAQTPRDPFASDPDFRFDREHVRRGRASLRYRRFSDNAVLASHVYATARDADGLRTLLLAPDFPDRAARSLSTWAVGGMLQVDRSVKVLGRAAWMRGGADGSDGTLNGGYRAVSEDGLMGRPTASSTARRAALGVFLMAGWDAAPRVHVTVGARRDEIWHRLHDSTGPSRLGAWSPRAGLNVRLGRLDTAPWSAFVQLSGAYKAPTLDQLSDPRPFPDFAGGSLRISNPTLLPQRARNAEVGASRRTPDSTLELSAYRMEMDDEIDFDPGAFRYGNIGATRHRGVELAVRIFSRRSVSPFLSYTHSNVESRSVAGGGQLKNIPARLLRLGCSLKLPRGIRSELWWSRRGALYLDDDHRFSDSAVWVGDLHVERRSGRARVRMDLLNVTGARYAEMGFALQDFSGELAAYHYPAPGFVLRAGMDWDF